MPKFSQGEIMEQRELLMNFMRSLKTKGLLDKDIHGSVVDVFINAELNYFFLSPAQSKISKFVSRQ